MKRCRLFGKDYVWVRDADWRLVLCPDATFTDAPLGPPSFDDVVDALAYVEEVGHAAGRPALATFVEERSRGIIEIEPTEDGWRQFRRADRE